MKIEVLQINQSHLTTARMLELMAVKQEDGGMPLYLHSITRILRELRLEQQAFGGDFNYLAFKERIADASLQPGQLAPHTQRLDTLESFMPRSQTESSANKSQTRQTVAGNDWTIKVC